MALDKAELFVPFAKGTAESIDSAARSVDAPVALANMEWTEGGRVRGRRGFQSFAYNDQDNAALADCRALFSTGEELILVGATRLYALNEQWSRWIDRGPVSPFCGKQWPLSRGTLSDAQADIESGDNGYTLHALVQQVANDPAITSFTTQLTFMVSDTDTGSVVAPWASPVTLTGVTASNNEPHTVRCTSCDDLLLAVFADGFNGAAAVNLKAVKWDTTSPSTAQPVAGATLATDLRSGNRNQRYHDAIRVGDNFCIAYIAQATPNIVIRLYNKTFGTVATSTIVGTFSVGVALAYDETNGQIYVLSVNGAETPDLELYARRSDTLAAVWGPTIMDSAGAGETFYTLGNATDDARVACTWGMLYGSGTAAYMARNRSTDTAGLNLDVKQTTYNALPTTRPWYQGGRCYVGLSSHIVRSEYYTAASVFDISSGGLPLADAWELGWVADIFVNEGNPLAAGGPTEVRMPEPVAVYDVGVAPNYASTYRRQGAANHVTLSSSNEWRFCALAQEESLAGKVPKTAASVMQCDFDKRPLVSSCIPSTAVIGGGLVSWYDGQRCFELGQALAPMPDDNNIVSKSTGDGTLSASTDYRYRILWEYLDAAGVVHRGVPSPIFEFEIGVGHNALDVSALTNPVTDRHPFNYEIESTLRVYREATDGLYYIATSPSYFNGNWWADDHTGVITDEGLVQGALLYTEGGEIEAIIPEGATIPVVSGGRLLLGDTWRRSRFVYSKPIAPGTATENQYAPEFNEGFGYVLPDDEEVRGMASMDGKTILFSSRRIYANTGAGPTDAGLANDFSGPQVIADGHGCITHHSVASFKDGIFFQTAQGIMLLDRSHAVHYVGFDVKDTIASFPTVTSAVHYEDRHQVRFTVTNAAGTQGRVLVYDYAFKAWSVWTVTDSTPIAPVAACVHGGKYYVATSAGKVYQESTSDFRDASTTYVTHTVSTGWLEAASAGGWQLVRRVLPLLYREDNCDLTISIYTDNESVATWSRTFTSAEVDAMADPDNALDIVIAPFVQKCTKLRVEVSDKVASTTPATVNGAGFSARGVTFQVGRKRGVKKVGALAAG